MEEEVEERAAVEETAAVGETENWAEGMEAVRSSRKAPLQHDHRTKDVSFPCAGGGAVESTAVLRSID
jgi:hypothetical protein